ncbi:MAG: PfkB family carbohydrate kinase [Candidatus Limnocylindrales bacterium]
MSRPAIEVVHIGSAARDIAPDDPRGWRLGGGVSYAALTTARLGLRTAALVGVDDLASTAREFDALHAAGVEVRMVHLDEGPIFHNTETPAGRVQVVLATGVPLDPAPVPSSWLAAPGWSLVPVAGEVGDGWVERIPDGATVAVGWQGLLRTLVAGERVKRRSPAPMALLRRADLVAVSHLDVDTTTRLADLLALLAPAARLLVTQGEHGGLLVTAAKSGLLEVLRYLPTRADRLVDATGAGDTFLAALLATVVRPSILRAPAWAPARAGTSVGSDLHFAAAAGSLAVEAVGLAGVPDLRAVLRRRAREGVRRVVVPSPDIRVGDVPAFS